MVGLWNFMVTTNDLLGWLKLISNLCKGINGLLFLQFVSPRGIIGMMFYGKEGLGMIRLFLCCLSVLANFCQSQSC